MQISLSSAQPKAWSGTVLALGIAEGDPNSLIPAMEERFSISLSDWLEQRKFQGKTERARVFNSSTQTAQASYS